jgi:hypothetical protein
MACRIGHGDRDKGNLRLGQKWRILLPEAGIVESREGTGRFLGLLGMTSGSKPTTRRDTWRYWPSRAT